MASERRPEANLRPEDMPPPSGFVPVKPLVPGARVDVTLPAVLVASEAVGGVEHYVVALVGPPQWQIRVKPENVKAAP